MAKKVTLVNHIDSQELYKNYRCSNNAISRSHYHIIWLIAQGKTVKHTAEITGYSTTWIYELVRRYNEEGVKALGDQRKNNPGKEPLLTDLDQANLWQVLSQPSPDGGLWNGRKVADWLCQLTGKKITRQRGWEILKGMTYRLRVTRPSHKQSDEAEQEEWKKNFKQS